ncbi:MAG: hypothetical protein PHU25_09135 [Deltaproteobacteria bacterium]|nr:hypothetical protein [Deltaproteobacteria bacterium]
MIRGDEDIAADPLLDMLAALPLYEPAAERAERIRRFSHAALAGRCRATQRKSAFLARAYTAFLEPAWVLAVVAASLAWCFNRVALLLGP